MSDSIVKESPVFSEETAEKFEQAIIKASMVYENIYRVKNYQYALLSEGNKGHKSNFALLYTSEIDKDVHLRKINGLYVFDYSESNGMLFIKEGFFVTMKENKDGTSHWTTDTKYGLVAHNGLEVLKPKYGIINDIDDQLFLVRLRTGEGKSDWQAVDYSGKILKRFPHRTILRYKHDTFGKNVVLVITETNRKEEKIGMYNTKITVDCQIHLIYRGKLRKVLDEKDMPVDIARRNKETVTIDLRDGYMNIPKNMIADEIYKLERQLSTSTNWV